MLITINKDNFKILTHQKGAIYAGRKITNNSNHIVFYNDTFVGEVKTQKDARRFIDNLVKYQRLVYTQE